MTEQTPMNPWKLRVEHMTACNCDWGCPCIYESRPTAGDCEGLVAWRVLDGSIDGVDLGGATWVTLVKWPGAIHEGNGRAVVFIDESVAAEHREARERPVRGPARGFHGHL
jgi:hypothetical protein